MGKFKMYYPSGKGSILSTVYLSSTRKGLIGDDLAISFSNIVALYAGKHEEYPDANPSASFMIEYLLTADGSEKRRLLLEVVHREKYLVRRNWWINSIISCVAYNRPFRVPPSVSALGKLLGAITDDTRLYALRFVNINDIEDSFSISGSIDFTVDREPEISIDAETARQMAEDRVKKYKRLQKDIRQMASQAQKRMEIKLKELSTTSIDVESIPFEDTPKLPKKISKPKRLSVEIPQTSVLESPSHAAILLSETTDQEPKIEPKLARKRDASPDGALEPIPEKNIKCTKFASGEETAKMRSTISRLTKKLQNMEAHQMAQTTKMQRFVEKESVLIKRYEAEIRKVRRRCRRLEHEKKTLACDSQDAEQRQSEAERTLKLQKWERSKTEQNKQKKLRTALTQLQQEMQAMRGKLEKTESGYNAALQNYHREQKQRQRMEREFEQLEQRYVCDTQSVKDSLLESRTSIKELKRHSKKLTRSLEHSEQSESKVHELLKNEIDRAGLLEEQITNLQRQLRQLHTDDSNQKQTRDKDTSERMTQQFAEFSAVNDQNDTLQRENKTLRVQIREMQRTLNENKAVLAERKRNILELEDSLRELNVQMKDKEKMYQSKLIDFTQYAQEQMTAQQQMLMDKMQGGR